MKTRADHAHKKYRMYEEAENTIHAEYLEATRQLELIDQSIRTIEERKRAKHLEMMIEGLSEEALRKWRENKKLTLDEYRLLRMRGLL